MGRPKKEQFVDLPEEWRDSILQSTPEAIDEEIARLAKGEQENQKAKEEDMDLAEKREAVKFASEGYRDSTKGFKTRMKFIMQVLADKGKA